MRVGSDRERDVRDVPDAGARTRRAAAALALAWLILPAGASGGGEAGASGGDADPIVLSFLAVGDTGWQVALPALRSGQRAVARGLVAEDRRRPVDALVLLGDLFYPRGLESTELTTRVRANVVAPYCHFADLSGPRSPEVAGACAEPEADRHPVPIFAVAGNHDYEAPGSSELLRRAVPEFVANWHMPGGTAAVVELGSGVSLVLLDAPAAVGGGDFGSVRAALRRARGPWRIVTAHLPVAPGDAAADGEWRSRVPPLAHFSLADAPVHLYLAGHRHNLQVIEGRPPGPALHVIAGSGSNVRPVRIDYANRRFAAERTGFVRVDLVGRGASQRLRVSLFTTPRYPIAFWEEPEPVSRWTVDLSGNVREDPPDAVVSRRAAPPRRRGYRRGSPPRGPDRSPVAR